MSATEKFIDILGNLKAGDLGLLRKHAGKGLDETVDAFDLFAGIWWPLRQKNQFAPRREVSWLIAKLYAFCPIQHTPGDTFARQLRRCQPNKDPARFRQRFDRLISQPLNSIEPDLQWALDCISSKRIGLDWVRLTDDLSRWEHESIRLQWAEQYLDNNERKQPC